jgi:hypothetical protein
MVHSKLATWVQSCVHTLPWTQLIHGIDDFDKSFIRGRMRWTERDTRHSVQLIPKTLVIEDAGRSFLREHPEHPLLTLEGVDRPHRGRKGILRAQARPGLMKGMCCNYDV